MFSRVLESAEDDFIAHILLELTYLYRSAPRKDIVNVDAWWTRLFELAIKSEVEPLDVEQNLYKRSINSSSGHLTEALLLDIKECHKAERTIPEAYLENLNIVVTSDGPSGTLARAVLIHNAVCLMSVFPEFEIIPLVDTLSGDDA